MPLILTMLVLINGYQLAKAQTRAEMGLADIQCMAIVENHPEAHETIAYKNCEEK